MEKKIIVIIVAVLLLLLTVTIWWLYKKPATAAACPYDGTVYSRPEGKEKYCFYQGKDSSSRDIANVAGGLEAAISACDADPNCIALNTSGWYKHGLSPYNLWSTWTTDPTKGLLTKLSAAAKY